MSPIVTALWVSNIVVDSVGHLAFKAAAIESPVAGIAYWLHMAKRPWLWLGIVCFGAEFLLWYAFLSLVPLAQAVLLGTISIVAIMLGGRLRFREHFSPLRTTGILLIAGGVALVGLV